MANEGATVVLVHGAWHGAWSWDMVTPHLDAARVPYVAVDNPSVNRPGARLHDDADNVRHLLDEIDGPVVLVGHSYGGAVITDAGAHDTVQHLVYVTAFALDDGESVTQNALSGGDAGGALEEAIRFEGDVLTLDTAGAIAAFYHDCPAAVAGAAAAKLRPQSIAALSEAPRAIAWKERPATYVVCTEDRALSPGLQRSCAARIDNTVEIATGHSPFLARPELVAGLLLELSRT
jgi:pimeloyl-ACP methyl ester carboxylesterase